MSLKKSVLRKNNQMALYMSVVAGILLWCVPCVAQFETMYFSAKVEITDENGLPLPGTNPDNPPYVQGAVVQLILAGADGIANPPASDGSVTGDDSVYRQIAIGYKAPAGVQGYFFYDFFSMGPNPPPSGLFYARIFNTPVASEATYYGQTAVVSKNNLPVVGFETREFYVNKFGLIKTNIPMGSVPVGNPPIAHAGDDTVVPEGQQYQLNAGLTTDTEDSLESLQFQWDLDGDSVYDDNEGVAPQWIWPDNTTYEGMEVGVRVTDTDGNSSIDVIRVIVTNVAPLLIAASAVPLEINSGQSVTLSGNYSDPGVLDTHTAHILWGEGSDVQIVPVEGGVFEVSHIYEQSGVYAGQVFIRDDDNAQSATQAFQVVVKEFVNIRIAKTSGSAVVISWNATDGKQYSLFRSDDMSSWMPLATVTGENGAGSFTDTTSESCRLYKLKYTP